MLLAAASPLDQTYVTTLTANTAVAIPVPHAAKWALINTTGLMFVTGNKTAATTASVFTGAVLTTGTVTGGSLYTTGTYTNVPLVDSTTTSATGAKATIVVAAGVVTTVTITAGGSGYIVADSLTALAANIGGTGSGFSVPVATITPTSFTSGAIQLPVAGSYQISLVAVSSISILSAATPTVTVTFSKEY